MSVPVSHEDVIARLRDRVGRDAVTIAAQEAAIDSLQADLTKATAAAADALGKVSALREEVAVLRMRLDGEPPAGAVTRSGEPDPSPAPVVHR